MYAGVARCDMQFEKFMRFLLEESSESWKVEVSKMLRKPSIMACLRWHFERNRVARLAIEGQLKTLARLIQTDLDTCVEADEFASYMYAIVEQMAQFQARAKTNTDLMELAAAAAEVTGPDNQGIFMALVAIAKAHSVVQDAGKTAVCAGAARFTASGMPVVVP